MEIQNNWWKVKRLQLNEALMKNFKFTSKEQPTKLLKIIINSGLGQFVINNKKYLEDTAKVVEAITGQKVVLTVAKKSITNFHIREGNKTGVMNTLRKEKAWNFLFELINIALPRISNFRGLSEGKFDRNGDYHFGINGLNIFPAADYELTFKNQGIQISLVFSSNDKSENKYFLQLLGFPFQKSKL